MQIFGVPKSVGQIYGLLYASPLPLGFSDIVERLEISKGSASQGLQLLRSLGAVKLAEPLKWSDVSDKAKREESQNKRSVEPSAANTHTPFHSHSHSHFHFHSGGEPPRRIAYEPELSLRKLLSGVLQDRIAPIAATGADHLDRLRELAEQDGDGDKFYLDRAKQLNTWRRRLKTVLPMLVVLLGPVRGGAKGKEHGARSQA